MSTKYFTNAMQNILNNEMNVSITENGAVGFKTTTKPLLDLNFKVASLRSCSENEIYQMFINAFMADRMNAMKWLFYARDIRGGLGERRLFRVIITRLTKDYPELVESVIPLVCEYGRYDDLLDLLDTSAKNAVLHFIATQLKNDIIAAKNDKPFSLLAKWMPSSNASSQKTKKYAGIIQKELGLTERNYRKTLSFLREKLRIVERDMSAKKWDKIDYEAVPSRANLIYNSAFLRNDEQRRREFLQSLEKGEAKINASTLFPHDIVHKYSSGRSLDVTLEQLWKSLPNTVNGNGSTIVVADGSGSMISIVDPASNVRAIEVANALAIYFAERCSGEFKDKYITFSERPQLVDLSVGRNLKEKIGIARGHSEVASTNIEAVFDLILKTAVSNKMNQEDLPQNILIISD